MDTRAKQKHLKQAYDLTLEEWDRIYTFQGKACFICQRPIDPPRKPHTDHDHRTGHVRGILCSQCNRALGKVEDPRWAWTPKHLLRAALYLSKYPATEALQRVVKGYPGEIYGRKGLTKKYREWAKKNPR